MLEQGTWAYGASGGIRAERILTCSQESRNDMVSSFFRYDDVEVANPAPFGRRAVCSRLHFGLCKTDHNNILEYVTIGVYNIHQILRALKLTIEGSVWPLVVRFFTTANHLRFLPSTLQPSPLGFC